MVCQRIRHYSTNNEHNAIKYNQIRVSLEGIVGDKIVVNHTPQLRKSALAVLSAIG